MSDTTPLRLLRTTSADAAFRALVGLLDADLRRRDGDDHPFYAQFNKVDLIQHVVVAYASDGTAVGCGAFRAFAHEAGAVEIKRMFVRPEYRGQGIATAVLGELEAWAATEGYRTTVLETGQNQPEAIGLYQKAGYARIANYPPYQDTPNSVCMRREWLG